MDIRQSHIGVITGLTEEAPLPDVFLQALGFARSLRLSGPGTQ
jgi:hypothetical protein